MDPHAARPEVAENQPASEAPVAVATRVHLAHAVLQHLADGQGVDLLHVKGPALTQRFQAQTRMSSDADVLVRPSHLARFAAALERCHWDLRTSFERGSPFEHAANYWHKYYGYADIHRNWPGIGLTPEEAFSLLWEHRKTVELAHWPCTVPDELDQALVLLLHAARGVRGSGADRDIDATWGTMSDTERDAVRRRAVELRATTALAAALDELDQIENDPAVSLWRYYREGGTRLDEWRARIAAEPSLSRKIRLLAQATRVNDEYEGHMLDRELTPQERRAIRRRRLSRATKELRDLARRGLGGGAK